MLRRCACVLNMILRLIFHTFFSQFELSHFSGILTMKVGALYAQLLLQFYSDSFETLRMS